MVALWVSGELTMAQLIGFVMQQANEYIATRQRLLGNSMSKFFTGKENVSFVISGLQ